MLPPPLELSGPTGAVGSAALPGAPPETGGTVTSPSRNNNLGSAVELPLQLAASLALIWILYRRAAGAYFVAEDFDSVRYTWASLGAELFGAGHLPGIRGGTVAFFALFAPLFGRDPQPYRLVLWLLFALCGLLVVRIALECGLGKPAALFSGMAFLAAPIHAEAAVWLAAAAGTVPSGLLVLAAIALWCRAPSPSPATVAACAACFLLAMLTKETAVVLPFLLAICDLARGSFPGWRPAKLLARYGWIAAVLGLYLAWLLAIGELARSLDYGVEVVSRSAYYLSVWSAYAQDLLRPVAPAKSWALQPATWSWSTVAWLWLGAFLLPLACRRLRWALLFAMAALLPGLTKYGARLTFLAVAGVAMAGAIALEALARGLERRVPPRRRRLAGLAPFLVAAPLLLVADSRALAPQLDNWVRAGEFARWVPTEVRRQIPAPTPGAEFFFADLIDNFEGAGSLRMGVVSEIQRVYGDPTVVSWNVRPGPARGPRRPLASIPCQSATPRYFLRYLPDSASLRLQSREEFGVKCPQG